MSNPEEFNILIVTDQRSVDIRNDLHSDLLNLYTPDMTLNVVAVNSSLGHISNLVSLANQNKMQNSGKYDFLYLIGGYEHMVCVDSGEFICPFGWVGEFVDNMYELYFKARNDLFSVAHRPVICEVIGLNYAKCNDSDSANYIEDQLIIDQGISHLNRAIASINMDVDVISPWFGSTVHSVIHHKLHHKYMKLVDGFNLCDSLRKTWASLLAKAMVKNCGWNT